MHSTDDTYALLQQLATADARIKLFQNPTNVGYNANFEKAIRLSVGDYIAFADQDDIWEKEKVGIDDGRFATQYRINLLRFRKI
jgi:glycosyltransferase involved in cell wall biosynthesis